MQTAQHISMDQLREIAAAIFDQGRVVVKEASSKRDCQTKQFANAQELIDNLQYQPGELPVFLDYAIYYPEARGYTFEKRITLKPNRGGHTFRFTQQGWGLIQFQCNFRDFPSIECRIAVNSEARADTRFDTYPDFKNPDLWDWNVIKKKAGRLIRLLRSLGKQAKDAIPD